MTTTEDTVQLRGPQRLSPQGIALLRAVVRWRRAHGVTWDYEHATYRAADGASVMWSMFEPGEIGVTAAGDNVRRWYRAPTLQGAVDLLVVLGYLPDLFSTSYRRGYHAGSQNFALAFAGRDINHAVLPVAA